MEPRSVCLPLMSQGAAVGLLYLEVADADDSAAMRVGVPAAGLIGMALANLQLRETLRTQSIRDPLTGLYNRRFLDETLEREIAKSMRHRTPLAVVMVDVDHFKRFNDTHGHEAGDRVLVMIAGHMKSHFRATDLICRFGGEEFMIVMPEASVGIASARVDEWRKTLKEQSTAMASGLVLPAVTASVGVAVMPEHGSTSENLIQAADAALYAAKRAGRDRVMVSATAGTDVRAAN
jgi:diguanylate cyclase (GGDEF)-like protein